MASVRGQLVRVGILMSVALGTLMLGLMLIGEDQGFLRRKVRFHIHFSRTNGLLVGAPVALTGVNVGSVTDIAFPEDPAARHIDVTIDVNRHVAPRIREDSIATVRTQGVLGDKYIELSAGTPTMSAREPGTVIPDVDPIDYEAVLGQSGDIVTNIVELTASLRNVVQSIDRGEGLLGAMVRNREQGEVTFADIQQAVSNVAEITAYMESILASVERGEGLIGALVRDTDTARGVLEGLTRSTENLDRFTARLDSGTGLLPRLIEDEAYAERVLADLETTTQALADLTSKLDRGEGTLGALIHDRTLYDETTAFVRTTRKSWTFRLYRGIRGLWPFGDDGAAEASGTEEEALDGDPGPPTDASAAPPARRMRRRR
jgi:phospholipid/cholesterol/gamma-HCH transport system substrate-binding protein